MDRATIKFADKATRFGNYILDKLGLTLLVILHAFVLDGFLHSIPEGGSPFLAIYFFFLYFIYHFLFEYFFGKTPGKFITKTKVTGSNGNKPSAKELLIRNLCRFIPFDNFSFLLGATGWHDSISATQVIHD